MYPSGTDVDAGTVAYAVASQNREYQRELEKRVAALETSLTQVIALVTRLQEALRNAGNQR